ncbi:50S ribosomal protein L4 [Candidatus Riesia sp. GBBU]|nr:50S ribosomal protein L4 [Candidatus Riesia sp. GBBU]
MKLCTQDTKEEVNVSDDIFKRKFNNSIVHQLVVFYRNSSRTGNKSQKNRSEVSGSKKKPWKQKGTGNARAGSKRSPIWRSGGVTFAAKPKKYKQKINRKMYRVAMRVILSELIRENRIILLSEIFIDSPKTKIFLKTIRMFSKKRTIVICENIDRNIFLASRNLNEIKVYNIDCINPVKLIQFENTILTIKSIKKIEERLS